MNNPMRNIIKDVIILFVISLIPLLWFPREHIVTGHDAGYPINVMETFRDRLFTWNSVESLGRDNTVNLGAVPIHSIEAAFTVLGLSLARSQQFAFIFWFFAMSMSMYYFAWTLRHEIPYRHFPLLASLLYVINFYLLALWRYGAGTTFSAYIALPLMIAYMMQLVNHRLSALKASILISISLFIFNGGGGFSLPLFGALIAATTLLCVYFIPANSQERLRFVLWRVLSAVVLIIIFSLFLHAFWLLPFLNFVLSNYRTEVLSRGGVNGVIAWADVVSQNTSIINLFRLQGFPDWYEGISHAYSYSYRSNPILITLSFLFAPLAYASLLLPNEKQVKKLVLFFVILSLVAIFLSAGTHKPTGWIFGQMMLHIPGFAVFRSAQYKFIPALYLSFAILISYVINYLVFRVSTIRKFSDNAARLFRGSVIVACIVIILIYHYPYFGTNFFSYTKPLTTLLKIPEYVGQYEEWIKDHLSDERRILILPPLSYSWKSEAYTWKYFSLYSLFNLIRPKPFLEYSQGATNAQLALIRRISEESLTNGPLLAKLATMLQVPYALLRMDSEYALDWVPSQDPRIYEAALTSHTFPKVWQNGKWSVYKLPSDDAKEKIFGVTAITKYVGPQDGVIAPILAGSTAFFQTEESGLNRNAEGISTMPLDRTVYSSTCLSCVLDETVKGPEAYASVLPGSPFYAFKEWRNRSLEDPSLSSGQLMENRLGLSFKRVIELNSLVILKRDVRHINETISRLNDYWKFVYSVINTSNSQDENYYGIRASGLYAKSELKFLTEAYNRVDEKESKNAITGILGLIHETIDFTNKRHEYWLTRKKYAIPPNFQKGEIFIDARSLTTGDDGTPLLPTSADMGSQTLELKPKIQGEKVTLGIFDTRGAQSVMLQFPDAPNKLSVLRTINVIGPEYVYECAKGNVLNFDWRKKYRIRFDAKNMLPDGSQLFIHAYNTKADNERDSQIDYLTKSVNRMDLDIYTLAPQYFYTEGSDGNIGMTLYFCTPKYISPEPYIAQLKAEEISSPYLNFISDHAEQQIPLMQEVKYKRVDQTKYVIDTAANTFPLIIEFNENFNNKWKLYDLPPIGQSSPLVQFVRTWFKEPLPEVNHFTVNGYANAWYLPKKPEGELVLEFYPQKLFYIGSGITIASLVLIIGIGLWVWRSKKN